MDAAVRHGTVISVLLVTNIQLWRLWSRSRWNRSRLQDEKKYEEIGAVG